MNKVFISYASEDRSYADKFRNYLKKNKIDVFDATHDIAIGESISSAISENIESSTAIIFIMSKNYLQSEWAKSELNYVISRLSKGDHKTIIPIKLDKNIKVPPLLADFKYIDLSDEQDFNSAVSQVKEAIAGKQDLKSYNDNIKKEIEYILAQKNALEIEKLNYEMARKKKTYQVTSIALLYAAISISVALTLIVFRSTGNSFPFAETLIPILASSVGAILGFYFSQKRDLKEKEKLSMLLEQMKREMIIRELHK